jgi:hypothetical protein
MPCFSSEAILELINKGRKKEQEETQEETTTSEGSSTKRRPIHITYYYLELPEN